MAITGVADTDIAAIAQKLGKGHKEVADALGYTSAQYGAPTLALAASGASVGTLSGTGWFGFIRVEWGDGTFTHMVGTGVTGVLASTPHTYPSTGVKTATITANGVSKQVTQTIT